MSAQHPPAPQNGNGQSAAETAPLLRPSPSPSPSDRHQTARRPPAPSLDDDEAPCKVGLGRALAITASVGTLVFLQTSNMSGMTMAQSTIAADLGAYERAIWFTSSYLMSLSSCAPLAGRLAAIFSPRVMVVASSIFFTIGALVTSQAASFSAFVLGRVISGLGAASSMVMPFILVLDLTSKSNRGIFMGLVNAGFTLGVSLGAVIFGAIITTASWRVIFLLQVPVSILAGLGAYISLPQKQNGDQGTIKQQLIAKTMRVDYLGAALLTTTLVLFLYSLSGQIQLTPLLLSLGSLAVFLLVEFRVASEPIVPLAILRNRGALLLCVSQLTLMMSRWSVLFYSPITALAVRGLSPAASGGILIPTNIGFGVGGLIVGWLHIRRAGSYYTACLVTLVLFGLSLLALAFLSDAAAPIPLYVAVVLLNGLFTGAMLNYALTHLLHLTPDGVHYEAVSLLGTFRGFASSFGSAIGGGIFARALKEGLERGFEDLNGGSGRGGSGQGLSRAQRELTRRLLGSPALVYHGGLGPREHEVAVRGYADALRILFQSAAALAVVVVLLQAAAGWRGPADRERDQEEAGHAAAEQDREREC